MRRTCIWLEEKDIRGMKWISKRSSLPVSALMRKAIEAFVQNEREKAMQQREGSLGILRYQSTGANVPEEYDVTFGRYDFSGVLRPRRLRGRAALISFLRADVELSDDTLDTVLARLDSQGSVSVPNVIFTDDKIARLGLAA
jgi:hypothetical protein